MKLKIREIALLMVPVAAVLGLIPILRRASDVRAEKREEIKPTKMNIVACETQMPTTWDAFNGAQTVLVTRTADPLTPVASSAGDLLQITSLVFRNEAGQTWNFNDLKPGAVCFPISTNSNATDSAYTQEYRYGLRWSQIAGSGQAVDVTVVRQLVPLNVLTLSNFSKKAVKSVTRHYTLDSPVLAPPLATLRIANFTLSGVKLKTSRGPKKLKYEFQFSHDNVLPLNSYAHQNWQARTPRAATARLSILNSSQNQNAGGAQTNIEIDGALPQLHRK